MKKTNILGGLVFVLLAVYIIGNGMGFIPNIPWFKIGLTILFVVGAVRELWKREFFGGILSLCALAWMYDDMLGIERITPFPLFFAGILLAIGLNMLFGKKKAVTVNMNGNFEDARTENWQDGRHVVLENNFGAVNKYVNAEAFSTANLENNFGSANVYFNNAVMANGNASVHAETHFGEMNLYFPRTWRFQMNQDSAFGSVNVFGAPNNDMDAPLVTLNVEANFGSLNIYFE